MSCGADLEANRLIDSLTDGEDFVIPTVDFEGPAFKFPFDENSQLFQDVTFLKNEDITQRTVDGTGTFDALMAGFAAHLLKEYDQSRITGGEYTKSFIALSEAAMGNAVQFLLGKDQAFWAAQTAQINAMQARVTLETAKVQLATAQLEALNQRANFALTKMRIATEEVAYCTAKFNLDNTMPEQLAILGLEKAGQVLQNSTLAYNLNSMLPKQLDLLTTQNTGEGIKNSTATFNLTSVLPQQVLLLKAQESMVKEQIESQRAQTLDTRQDGITVTGVLGKQKALYTQQITSYQRDSEVKASKLFTDAWITMKSIDEGLLPPTGFTNSSLDTILATLKTNNELN